MAKSSPPAVIILMLCSHIIFMQTSALDYILVKPQTTIQAQIGEELHITCNAHKCSDKNPGFTWSSLMDTTLSGAVKTEEKTSNLIMKVKAETEGTYRCSVKCDNPPVEKGFKITVYSFPSDPVLQISSLLVGQTSRITCDFLDIFPAEVLTAQILVDGKVEATTDYETEYYGMENISLAYDLILKEEMDNKEIRCVGELNLENPIERHTVKDLTLIYPPSKPKIIVQPPTTVKAGEDIHLSCSSDSKSQDVLQWVKLVGEEKHELPSNKEGTLILSNAEPKDSGVYICHAKNSAGIASSLVEINVQGLPEKPTLSVQPSRVLAGQAVIIECHASGDTNVRLWKMSEDGDVLFVYPSGEITISEADPIDAAVYKCTSENQYGVSETSESLTVEYSPKKTVLSSSSADVKEGDSVNLTCISQGFPTPDISIYELLSSGESVLLSEGPEVTLSRATSGVYQCRAENMLGTDKHELELIVQVPPKNTTLNIGPSHTVREGERVLIRCTSESIPAPKLVLRMKTELDVTELEEAEHGSYIISHATVDHTGTYICEASNVIGQQIVEATLTVQVPPRNTHLSITPSSVVREGDDVQIRCTSEALPAPILVLKMIKENGETYPVSEGGEYNISNAGVKDIGTYICESTNAAGNDTAENTLNMEVVPLNTIIDITPSQVVKEGDSVQIRCSVEGSPDPGLVLKMSTEEGQWVTLDSSDGFYNISHVGIENAGIYMCQSVVGQEPAMTTLTVQIPPRNTTVVVTPSQNIQEGDTVTITCETHSIPSPTIILQKVCDKNNTVLQSNNGTFTLHNVTRNDTGTYTLEIISSSGNITESFNISVAEKQEDPNKSPRFNPTSMLIFGSAALVVTGVIMSIIYHLKKSKVQGSYSLVKALTSKV